jgi:hypothetical protein
MNKHHAIQKNLYDYLREELTASEQNAVETHLRSCEVCAAELRRLRETTELLDNHAVRPSETRGELYWQQFASKVDRRIQVQETEREAPSLVSRVLEMLVDNRKPFGVGFATALSLIAIAFAVWSLWIKSPDVGQVASASDSGARAPSTSVEKVALESRAQDYLEQSKIVLIGLVNADPKAIGEASPLLVRQREVSRILVRESEDISSKLTDPSQRQLRELVSDLGLILMQIANLEMKHEAQGVEIVKNGVEQNGILFRINLEEIARATRQTRAGGKNSAGKPTI